MDFVGDYIVKGSKIRDLLATTFRAISKMDLLYWLLASLISVIGTLLILPTLVQTETSSFELAMRAIDVVAYTFTLAIPIFLGASILLTTEGAHQNFVSQSNQGQNLRALFTSIFFLLFALCSVITVPLTIGAFLLAQLLGQLSMAVYILGTVFASFLMILILCPVGVLIALVFDDWKTSTGLGAGLFLVLTFTTGMPSSPSKYTELAFLGPVQYFRAVAASLAGVEFPSALEMVNHFGVYFTWESLVVPTVILAVISGLSLWISSKVFEQNLLVWKSNHGLWQGQNLTGEDETYQPAIETLERARVIQKRRKQLRRNIMSLLILVIFLIPTSGYGYTVYRDISNTTVLYEGQHALPIGQWLYGEFSTAKPPYPHGLMIRYDIDVLDWNGCPDSLIRQHGCRVMSVEEFESLNDSERRDAGYASGSGLVKPETRDEGSYGVGLYDEMSNMVWAIRFVDSNWNITSGTLTFSITVSLWIHF